MDVRLPKKSVRLPKKIGTAPADTLNLIPDSGFLIPDPLSSSSDFKSEDDEYFASLAEQEQKRQAEADARVKVEMTPDWQPDLKVLDDHLKFLGIKVLVNGKAVTSADLTAEITSDFRSAGHRKQERRTNHDWHGGLANYLIARIKNPKPETPKNSLPGGSGRYIEEPLDYPIAKPDENLHKGPVNRELAKQSFEKIKIELQDEGSPY